MRKMTVKAYAQKHKKSIFNVMKLVKDGSLQTLKEIENDKEVLYIIEDENAKLVSETKTTFEDKKTDLSIEEQIGELRNEVEFLKNEILRLQKEVAVIQGR